MTLISVFFSGIWVLLMLMAGAPIPPSPFVGLLLATVTLIWFSRFKGAWFKLLVALLMLYSVGWVGVRLVPSDPPSAPQNERMITRAELGEEWPFSVESGTLKCSPVSVAASSKKYEAITFSSGGTTYAVNGIAEGADIKSIWLENPQIPGGRISISKVISIGLGLCKF